MTQRRTWLRTAHRVHTVITVAVVLTLLVLNLTGLLSGGMALRLFLAIEAPLLIAFLAITVLRFKRFRRSADTTDPGLLDRIEKEEPLLRPVVTELRAFGSLYLAATKKRQLPPRAEPFGYTRGTMTIPTVMIAVSLAELAVVHFLVPWEWLRIVLLILTIWAVLFILGFFATRIVHPHFINNEALHLRWGHQSVLATPLTNIVSAARHANHAHTQPQIDGERLILTQFQSTNVLIRFLKPVAAAAPVAKKNLPTNFCATEVQLYVDDPDAFLHSLQRLQDEVTT